MALLVFNEGIGHYRILAKADPVRYGQSLAGALDVLSPGLNT